MGCPARAGGGVRAASGYAPRSASRSCHRRSGAALEAARGRRRRSGPGRACSGTRARHGRVRSERTGRRAWASASASMHREGVQGTRRPRIGCYRTIADVFQGGLMRSAVLAAIAAVVLLAPAAVVAQARDQGPDAGLQAQLPAAAHAGVPIPGSTDTHPDPACDAQAASQPDARADRANCRKLTDAEIATAPINEVRVVSRHVAHIGGREIPYTATAGTLTL